MTAPLKVPAHRRPGRIPSALKWGYTVFVTVLVPLYWVEYGPMNFLWASDIALLITLLGLWLESRLLISMMALGVLIPELIWTADLVIRFIGGVDSLGYRGTNYMFEDTIPVYTRCLGFYHLLLPVVMLFALQRLGYQRQALPAQCLLAWLVLPLSYVVSDAAQNINWVHGFGGVKPAGLSGPGFLLLLMVLFPVVIYLPTHLLLKRLFVPASQGPLS
jgi:hypothetical protein